MADPRKRKLIKAIWCLGETMNNIFQKTCSLLRLTLQITSIRSREDTTHTFRRLMISVSKLVIFSAEI